MKIKEKKITGEEDREEERREGPCSRIIGVLIQYMYLTWNAVLQIGRSLVRSQPVSFEIFIAIKSFRSHYDPEVDSASDRNEYREYFLGVKAAGA